MMMRPFFFFCVMILLCPDALYALTDGDAPIAIDADSLEILQQKGQAIFQGNVVATQKDMTIHSDVMTVYYEHNADGAGAMGDLQRIEVQGNVTLKTPDESAKALRGVYDAQSQRLHLFRDVVLRRGANVIRGSKLEYDVKTSSSMITGGGMLTGKPKTSGARVRGLFIPSQKEQ